MSSPRSVPLPTPVRLSDIQFSTASTTAGLYATLKSLKKSSLSLHNRLGSILHDAAYVSETVHDSLFPDLPVLANERCGSWYVPPRLKRGSAYFKSTDGHYGAWAFSTRRLNLQVLDVLGGEGGAVLVDSTRRGKRMPDALRRTVPVWVLVWNRILFGGDYGEMSAAGRDWIGRLQHPGLEDAEVALIEQRVSGWIDELRALGLDLETLRRKVVRPIKLAWVVQGEDLPESSLREHNTHAGKDCNLLVLCSASRRVLGAEMSEDGYVQGAADDAEGWSGGLTSALFWEHTDELLTTPEGELPDSIKRMVEEARVAKGGLDVVLIEPTRNVFIASSLPRVEDLDAASFDLIINCNEHAATESPRILTLSCRSGKLGSRDLRDKLPVAIDRVSEILKKNTDAQILVICETCKDLSVGVTVAVLCLLYDDTGQLTISDCVPADKQLVKKRLAWITTVKPGANPSRSTLQAVNSFLMQPPT